MLEEFLHNSGDLSNVFRLRRKYKCSPCFYVETMEDVLFKSLAIHKKTTDKTKILQNIKNDYHKMIIVFINKYNQIFIF